jgi:hypothetical protein
MPPRLGRTFVVNDDIAGEYPYNAISVIGSEDAGMGHLAVWIAPRLLLTLMPADTDLRKAGVVYKVAPGGGLQKEMDLGDLKDGSCSTHPVERGAILDLAVAYRPERKDDAIARMAHTGAGPGEFIYLGYGNGGERRLRGMEVDIVPDQQGRLKMLPMEVSALKVVKSEFGVGLLFDSCFELVGIAHHSWLSRQRGWATELLGDANEGFVRGICWLEKAMK